MNRNTSKFGLLVALTATLCAAQQGALQKQGNAWSKVVSGSVAAARNLHVKLDSGDVRVQGGQGPGISYSFRNRSFESSEERAHQQLDQYKISAFVRGDTAWIVAEWQGGNAHRFHSDVTITVPRALELVKIETGTGNINVTQIEGRVDGESGGGNIHLDEIGGEVNIQTGGGNVDIGNIGSDLKVQTGGGSIRIGSVNGRVSAETGGGELRLASATQGAVLETGAGPIHVDKCIGELKVTTGGGSIDLGEVSGETRIDTGGGTIKLISSKGRVKADSGSGCIELWGVPSAHVETGTGTITAKFIAGGNTDSELETGMGDITVYLAANLHATVQASIEAANGHSISSDFSEIKVSSEGGQWGPKLVTAEGALNGGGPLLKVRTTMGNIYIKRAQ